MLVRKLALNTVATKLFLQGHSESPQLKTTAVSANQGVLLERLTFRAGRKCCLSSVRQNSRWLIYTQHLQLSCLKFYRVSARCVFITSRKHFSRLSLCHLFWLACVTGLIFSRFSGEQRQARSERGAPARHLQRRKALLARFARLPSLVRKREKTTPVMQANSDRLTSQVHN